MRLLLQIILLELVRVFGIDIYNADNIQRNLHNQFVHSNIHLRRNQMHTRLLSSDYKSLHNSFRYILYRRNRLLWNNSIVSVCLGYRKKYHLFHLQHTYISRRLMLLQYKLLLHLNSLKNIMGERNICLLYTSDAADE